MSEEQRLKINQNRNNLETLWINAEGLEEGIEELIEFDDPEGRDLSIAMTVPRWSLQFRIRFRLIQLSGIASRD
jgi:hypothetical protein